MFLLNLFGPQIAFNSGGGGGGGGGGGDSRRDARKKTGQANQAAGKYTNIQSYAPKSSPKPKPRPATVTKAVNPRAAMHNSMKKAGIMTLGGKQTPLTPYNAGNPAIRETNSKGSKIVGGLYKDQKVSMATNKDGSLYVPYDGKDAHNYNAKSKANPTGKTIMKSTIPDNDKMVAHIKQSAKEVTKYNESVTAPVKASEGSSAPVTAPEVIDPKDGVGGGRDGGASGKSKLGKTDEGKVDIKRKAEGVDRYKTKKTNVKANPMAIRQSNAVGAKK